MTAADAPPPYAGVVFDCDSTLCAVEGIEELARLAGRHVEELALLTSRAMEGELRLEEVYGRRLALVRPTAAEVAQVGRRYRETLLPGARELVAALRFLGKRVLVVSGGLAPAVRDVARELGLADADARAVEVRFDAAGSYAGFDAASPLARAGGKLDVLRELGAELRGPLALVGDGATDLEAAPAAARFVAFGGVVRRPAVFAGAAVRAEDPDLSALAPLLLTSGELARLAATPAHARLARQPMNPSR